jgi:hypothetical protein
VQWSEVPVEGFSTVLQTHLPVCWDCYIAQSFVREHPDLVVYMPGRYDMPGDATARLRHVIPIEPPA